VNLYGSIFKMKRSRLDKIDKNILRRLQSDGRISNINLSKAVGISAPPCLRRVRALEEAGYIDGYHAQINPASMGYGVTVFAMVTLKSQAEEDLRAFEKHVSDIPMVRECYALTGEIDFLLKIVAKSWDDYQTLFTSKISNAPDIKSIKSSLTIRIPKNECGIPIE